ncbi:UNVERIFIED_CONTAM: hypothetical protein PYX00_005901 [Menopon gallinae]|uniref:Gustatory receptor n=1 Tax=Menopon gallinae TaxID=328185 RepID=A0AAW2HT89_9NEOP
MERQPRFRQGLSQLRKKCRIRTVFSIIRFTLRCSKYLLLMPYDSTPENRFRTNFREFVIFSAILFTVNSVLLVNSLMGLEPRDQNNPYALLGFARHVFSAFYIAAMAAAVSLKVPAWTRLINSVVEWDTILPLSGRLMMTLTFTVFVQFVYFAVKATLYVYFASTSRSDADAFYYTITLLSCFAMIYCEGRYVNIICTLAWLNAYIDAVNQEIRATLIDGKGEDGRKQAWGYHSGLQAFGTCQGGERVRRLRFFHGKLMDAKDEINNHYSFELLITITSIFIDMVFFVFLIITIFQYRNHIEADSLLINKFQRVAIITLSQVTKLVFTVFLCEKVKTKGSTAPVVVHKALHTVDNFQEKNEVRTSPE